MRYQRGDAVVWLVALLVLVVLGASGYIVWDTVYNTDTAFAVSMVTSDKDGAAFAPSIELRTDDKKGATKYY